MDIIKDLTVERVPLDSITEHPENARRGDVEVIKESLRAHGLFKPIVVQTSTRHIIVGNHTSRAARELGWTDIEAVMLDVDDDQAKRIMLADNRTSDLGGYDEVSLTDLLRSLADDLTGTGYEPGDLDARLAELRPTDAQDPTAAEMLEGWQNKDARTVLLTYTVAEHQRICDALDGLSQKFGLDTYSQVVAHLIEQATA